MHEAERLLINFKTPDARVGARPFYQPLPAGLAFNGANAGHLLSHQHGCAFALRKAYLGGGRELQRSPVSVLEKLALSHGCGCVLLFSRWLYGFLMMLAACDIADLATPGEKTPYGHFRLIDN